MTMPLIPPTSLPGLPGGNSMVPVSDWFPPLEPEDQQEAFEDASQRLAVIFEDTFTLIQKLVLGWWQQDARRQFAFYKQKEPWFLTDPTTGVTNPSPWLAALIATDKQETKKHVDRYRLLKKRYEGEQPEVAPAGLPTYQPGVPFAAETQPLTGEPNITPLGAAVAKMVSGRNEAAMGRIGGPASGSVPD